MSVANNYKSTCCTGNCRQGRACPSPHAANAFAAIVGAACIAAPFIIWFMRVPA